MAEKVGLIEKVGLTEDILIERIALSLIISPLFSVHTPKGCHAHNLFSTYVTNLEDMNDNKNKKKNDSKV